MNFENMKFSQLGTRSMSGNDFELKNHYLKAMTVVNINTKMESLSAKLICMNDRFLCSKNRRSYWNE